MYVEVRIYKRFDTDLLALHTSGFSVRTMMKDALVAYATGKPYHVNIEEMIPFDLNDKATVRVRLLVSEHIPEVKALLQTIKKGYRSNFCKQLLRNALIQQNLSCYFDGEDSYPLHEANAGTLSISSFSRVVPASIYRHKIYVRTLDGRDLEIKEEKGKEIRPKKQYVENKPSVKKEKSVHPRKEQSEKGEINVGEPVRVNGQLMVPVITPDGIQLVPIPSPAAAPPETKTVENPVEKDDTVVVRADISATTGKNTDPVPVLAETYTAEGESADEPSSAPSLAGDDSIMKMFDNI